MSSPGPFGLSFADALRHYLATNNLKQSQLTHSIVAELADRHHEHFHEQIRLKKKRFTDAEWLADLQGEDCNRGTNVSQQFDLAKLWCKQKQRNCTRAFFLNWLIKAASDAPILHEQPKKADYRLATAYEAGDFDWCQWIAKHYPRETYPDRPAWEEGPYKDVPFSIRNELTRAQ